MSSSEKNTLEKFGTEKVKTEKIKTEELEANRFIYDEATETLDDLQLNGLHLVQYKDGFRFGIDAVLLANFAASDINSHGKLPKQMRVLDVGTGTGVIPILMSAKIGEEALFEAIDVQERYAKLAERNVEMNSLSNRIKIVHGNVAQAEQLWQREAFDVVVSNPPYVVAGRGINNAELSKNIARQEITCSLEEIIKSISYLLKDKGVMYMVHRPGRMVDIFESMRKHQIEPKRFISVHSRPEKKPDMILIKGVKKGGRELRVEEPISLYNENGKLKPATWFE